MELAWKERWDFGGMGEGLIGMKWKLWGLYSRHQES
jgi:hypothetical protein